MSKPIYLETFDELLETKQSMNDIAKEVYKTAKEKGWYDSPREDGTVLMLMVSEISEAMESLRNNEFPFFIKDGKPEGTAVELADCVIRIMDYFEHKGWNMEEIIKAKMEYNKKRPYKHGGKAF